MTDKELAQSSKSGESGSHSASRPSRVPIIVALIASATSLAGLLLTYVFTERARTEIANQTLQLERIKVDISAATQKTAEVAARVDMARLELERQIARSRERIESRKVQIEDRKGTTEEVRLTPDLTKLSNELRPNVDVSCYGDPIDGVILRITCNFKNKGAHRAKVEPKLFSMLNRSDQTEIPGTIQKIDNAGSNNILPNGAGSNVYEIFLTPAGVAVKNPIISIKFDATTDEVAVAMTKRLSKGIITDEELRSFSTQRYIFNLRY